MTAEKAASKAREEAIFYKDAAVELDKEKGLIKADLASAREAYQEMCWVFLTSLPKVDLVF